MYKFLEYGDAHYVVDYIYESDIYDEEKFLFAPDVDILKTSELDIRNSLFTYFICYSFNDMRISSLYFSVFGVIFTLIYIVIALKIVYNKAPSTFRIK